MLLFSVNSRMLSEDSGKISCAADLLARDYTWKHGIADGGGREFWVM